MRWIPTSQRELIKCSSKRTRSIPTYCARYWVLYVIYFPYIVAVLSTYLFFVRDLTIIFWDGVSFPRLDWSVFYQKRFLNLLYRRKNIVPIPKRLRLLFFFSSSSLVLHLLIHGYYSYILSWNLHWIDKKSKVEIKRYLIILSKIIKTNK